MITISPNHFGETPLAPTDTYMSPTMRVSTTNLHNPEPDTNPHDALGQCIRTRHCDHAARGQKDNVWGPQATTENHPGMLDHPPWHATSEMFPTMQKDNDVSVAQCRTKCT